MNANNAFAVLVRSAALAAAICMPAPAALAGDCPGNPNALGTSRTLIVDPAEHRRVGIMQYGETIPLNDHEVVLTFDDGPLPPHTNAVLDTLASQCVKATFFMVGKMAKEFPEAVRRVHAEGHSIGTHSNSHPFNFGDMPTDKFISEIEDGISNTSNALGESGHMSPFFRIPGLRTSDALENYLASRDLMLWSSDFLADDWRHISSAQVVKLALARLEAKGKGILLLHDIQKRTQDALPVILRELKARGYRIVHVEATTADRPKTPTEPQQWFFRQPHELSPSAKLSIQSIQLAKAPSAKRAPEAALLSPPDNFQMSDASEISSKVFTEPHAKTPLPGSASIQPAGITLGPLTTADPLKLDGAFIR